MPIQSFHCSRSSIPPVVYCLKVAVRDGGGIFDKTATFVLNLIIVADGYWIAQYYTFFFLTFEDLVDWSYIVLCNRIRLFQEVFHGPILLCFRMRLLFAHWGLEQPLGSLFWTTPPDVPLLSPGNSRSSCASNRENSDVCGRSVPVSLSVSSVCSWKMKFTCYSEFTVILVASVILEILQGIKHI